MYQLCRNREWERAVSRKNKNSFDQLLKFILTHTNQPISVYICFSCCLRELLLSYAFSFLHPLSSAQKFRRVHFVECFICSRLYITFIDVFYHHQTTFNGIADGRGDDAAVEGRKQSRQPQKKKKKEEKHVVRAPL